MYKLIIVILTVICFTAQANEQCPNIAAFSKDGNYQLLDSSNLNVLQVGDLKRFDIFDHDGFIFGSDINLPVVHIDRHKSFSEKRNRFGGDDVILPPLKMRHTTTFNVLNMSELELFRRLEGSQRIIAVDFQKQASRISIFDSNARLILRQTVDFKPNFKLSACVDKDNYYLLGRSDILAIGQKNLRKLALDESLANSLVYSFDSMDNCNAIIGLSDSAKNSNMTLYIIELTTGRIAGRFMTERFIEPFLYDNGKKVILQKMKANRVSKHALKIEETDKFELIDTTTGNLLLSKALDKSYGKAQKLICKNTRPKLILTEKNKIHLLDAQTLTIIASQEVPFERFFVL